jgi:hypothetical protein
MGGDDCDGRVICVKRFSPSSSSSSSSSSVQVTMQANLPPTAFEAGPGVCGLVVDVLCDSALGLDFKALVG